mmetsp:Transcript_49431/g.119907  ORF Transcript_49431/g.119907 Transcript_49431/m.119907 type:complete len:770 (-) Transcript_49431:3028-5337(-)
MPEEQAVTAACQKLLPGLDDDIFEYLVSLLQEDVDDVEETTETISTFLMGAEFCEDEDVAQSTAKGLLDELLVGSSNGADSASAKDNGSANTTRKLENPVAALSLQDVSSTPIESGGGKAKGKMTNTLMEDKTATSSKQARAVKKQANQSKGKSKLTVFEQAQAEKMELETELQEARIASIQSRRKLGAYKGALDASTFTLANPGGGQPLLEDASCTLIWGRRYGLIGRNGTGKSTLLRAFAARRVGSIPPNVTVHYVSQEVNLTESQRGKTPVECVVEADLERSLLLEELAILEKLLHTPPADFDAVEGSKKHADVLARLDEIGSDSATRRATQLLDNLGFSPELQARPLAQLSGGWRVRTMLAAAIFAKPDLLLLDEPTNHLSILAVMWLARELSTSDTWKDRMVIIVSHDRHFMDEVCTDCLHISGAARRLTQTRGNYSKWAKQRKEQQARFAKEQEHRQGEIDKLREYAGHGFKYGGSASQINKMGMKAKQADKLEEAHAAHAEELAALQEDMELPMKIHAGGELDGFLVQLKDVGFGYPNSTPARLFEHCEFGITAKSRIVMLGENGRGKSTLVKLLMGELEPCDGDIRRSPHARFAVVNQHHADQIDLTMTPLEFIAKQYPGDGSYEHMQKLRGHLSSCGVTAGGGGNGPTKVLDLQNTPASALSGGQRSRVALAAVSYSKPHVLILDEPTNNLDLESVAALAESVQGFQGAVVCVSHDQFFVTAVANEAWVVDGGRVTQVESFDAYRSKQLKALNKQQQYTS